MMRLGPVLLSLAASAALAGPASGQGAGEDKLAFNNHCRTCHVTDEGDHRLGPSLHNVVGREAGSLPDYGYSSAMKNADLVWDEENLDRYIANPDAVVPGNNMKPYSGISSAEERAKIISFLKSQNAGG